MGCPDTDSDGYSDAEEVAVNRDPADPNNFPNEAPIMADQAFTIAERLIDVATIVASDRNIEDTLTFTVTDEETNFLFEGNQLKVTDRTVLDYEVATQVTVNVQVSDGVLTDTAVITVNLTDDREEDFDGDGLNFVEWPEQAPGVLPADAVLLEVRVNGLQHDGTRELFLSVPHQRGM